MSRRVSPMATRHTRSWRSLADEAIAARAGAEHGERGARIAAVARKAATTPVLVRRAITARVALLKLEDKGTTVPDVVWTLPVGVAEAVARWAGRDPQTAWRYAEDYAADRMTFQSVIDAERASREAVPVRRPPRLRPDADPDAWRARQIATLGAIQGRRVIPPAADDLPVHCWVHDERPGLAAVLVAGPHADLPAYLTHRASYCVTAVGLARLAGRSILVVPDEDVALHYSLWLTGRSVSRDDVAVETVLPARQRRSPRPAKN